MFAIGSGLFSDCKKRTNSHYARRRNLNQEASYTKAFFEGKNLPGSRSSPQILLTRAGLEFKVANIIRGLGNGSRVQNFRSGCKL